MISLTNVSFRYGDVPALTDVTVEIESGVNGVVGPNGAGKSTLLRLVLGLTRPHSGTIRVLGADPATNPQLRARLGYSSEGDSLPEDSRPIDALRLLARLNGIGGREAVRRSGEILDLVGVDDERIREYGTLSTGQKQRVKIALALVGSPRIVVLDEPTNGLDPIQRDSMLSLISRVSADFGITVLFSTHLVEEVRRIADKAVVLQDGKVVSVDAVRSQDSNRLRVVCGTDPKPLAARLTAKGHRSKVAKDTVVVTPGAETVFDDIRDAAVATSTPIRRLEPDLMADDLKGAR